MSKRMKDKRVLVTGAGTGIGQGVALEFAKEGAAVVLHYSSSGDGAESAVEEIRSAGGKAEAMQANFKTLDDIPKLADDAIAYLGGLDVLINNAGITQNAPIEEITAVQWNTLYNVNVRAAMFLTQKCLPALIESKPSAIVNLSSIHAYRALHEHSIYAGTKGAIVAYTRELSVELAPKGITVNCIAPGWIIVDNHYKVLGEIDLEEEAYHIPAGFVGRPSDVGRVAIFLASEDARYIVGQTILMDGGASNMSANSGDFRKPRGEAWGEQYVSGG